MDGLRSMFQKAKGHGPSRDTRWGASTQKSKMALGHFYKLPSFKPMALRGKFPQKDLRPQSVLWLKGPGA